MRIYGRVIAEIKSRELSALFAAGEKLNCNNLLLVTDHEDGTETNGRRTVKIINVVDWLLSADSSSNLLQ